MRFIRLLMPGAAAALALAVAPSALAQTAKETAEARDAIFAMEKQVYASRANGNMDLYVAHSSPKYLGWPPGIDRPEHRGMINANQTNLVGNKEKNQLTLAGFTLDGDTAIIYDVNHRTMRGDGTPVDESFDNIHVWVKRRGQWMLLGTLPRPSTGPRR